MTGDRGTAGQQHAKWDGPELPPSRSAQIRGKSGHLLRQSFAIAFLLAIGVGPPVAIVFGVIHVNQANQIRAHGVDTTGTVTGQNYYKGSCQYIDVRYETTAGQTEQGTIGTDNCLDNGTTVNVVYDPSAPNVVQYANDRGDTIGGWSEVITGGFFTALVWGLVLWAALTGRHRKVRARLARRRTLRTSG